MHAACLLGESPPFVFVCAPGSRAGCDNKRCLRHAFGANPESSCCVPLKLKAGGGVQEKLSSCDYFPTFLSQYLGNPAYGQSEASGRPFDGRYLWNDQHSKNGCPQ